MIKEQKKDEFIDEKRKQIIEYHKKLRDKVIINNKYSSRNYAAGILPSAICEETGEPYFLLGINGRKEFSVFWGWQDQGDVDCEYTACREATEEGLGCFGNFDTLKKALSDSNSSEMIFNYCFMVYLGKLSSSKMNEITQNYHNVRFNTKDLKKCQQEMGQVRWFNANHFREAILKLDNIDSKITLKEFQENENLREFFQGHMKASAEWKKGSILDTFCVHKKPPLDCSPFMGKI